MKKSINTLQEALAFQLQALSYAEARIKKEFSACSRDISSAKLKTEIKKYVDDADSKLLKLERIFNYLMQEPVARTNQVINKLIDEADHMLDYASTSHLKDIVMITCIQNINAYKISCYRTAYTFAIELELDTASDLFQQILELELETSKGLSAISIEEFNKTELEIKSI